jgi:hypothetical protein
MQNSHNIIELLKDTAFPQMLLIDGEWGSGKTHYIRTELASALNIEFNKSHKLHYLSLYGISSIDDFRDRLISLTISDNGDSSKLLTAGTQLLEGLATNLGERGIGGILNGAAGAYKYKIYSGLDNRILILDDLERVSDVKTIRDILGECLNLAESKNIKVIVVANEKKLSCKNDIEKVFVDKIKFAYTSNEVASILKKMFPDELPDSLYNELILHITSTGSSNIRVLKRALIKFKKLKQEIEVVPNISLAIALSNTLRQVVKICYAKFEAGYSSEEIKESATSYMTSLILNDKNSDNSNNERQIKLDSIIGREAGHDYLVDYCCDGVYKFEDIATELNLPIERRLLDKIINGALRHQLCSEDFDTAVVELTDLIHSKKDLDINEWFVACDIYIHLVENKFIKSELSRDKVVEISKKIKIESFDLESVPYRDSWNNFLYQEVYKSYQDKLSEIKKLVKCKETSGFSHSFYLSWADLEKEVYQALSHSPFLQKIGLDNFILALNNWSSSDVHCFSGYMKEKYSFSNIEDYFLPEHEIIQDSISKIEVLLETMEPGLKAGSIKVLQTVFIEINTKMSKKLAVNQNEG